MSVIDLRAARTSFVGNVAETGVGTHEGGAVQAFGDVVLENVTFDGNAAAQGGALWMDLAGDLEATFVTFRGNAASAADGGADLHLAEADGVGTGTVLLRGVLLGGVAGDSEGPACGGDVTFDATGPALTWTDSFERVASVGGVTGPGSCGGPPSAVIGPVTFGTVAFLPGTSPLPAPAEGAVTIGSVTCGAGWPDVDQRGLERPQGAACDAGAVERLVVTTVPGEEDPEVESESENGASENGESENGESEEPADDGEAGPDPEATLRSGAPQEAGEEPGAGAPSGSVTGITAGPVPTSIPAGGGACADGCPALGHPALSRAAFSRPAFSRPAFSRLAAPAVAPVPLR